MEEKEEDWSEFAKLDGGFARSERRMVRIGTAGGGTCLVLECQPSLSPLDMLDLGDGSNDATGHVVWMGAYLFLEALRCPGAWTNPTLEEVFARKSALELGCGTGIAGLAALVSLSFASASTSGASGASTSGASGASTALSSLVLTDFDEGVLDLCRRNCEHNLDSDQLGRCSIQKLSWGPSLQNEAARGDDVLQECHESIGSRSFDTVFATDVLYDISLLNPLLTTVSKKLRSSGYMILSHVPRASLCSERAVSSSAELEEYITKEATMFGLRHTSTVRPDDILQHMSGYDPSPLNDVSLEDMSDAGAAILIFQIVAAKAGGGT